MSFCARRSVSRRGDCTKRDNNDADPGKQTFHLHTSESAIVAEALIFRQAKRGVNESRRRRPTRREIRHGTGAREL
jgi:hypothetical protein